MTGVLSLGWAAFLCPGVATADDGSVTYTQMEKILKSQGATVIQTTSIGDQVPKSQCLVIKQLTSANGPVMLSLDCRAQPKSTGSQ